MKEREEQILLLLQRFDFLTRDQLCNYFKLGTTRNTNRVLRTISEYLVSFREGYQSIYYLSPKGKKYVDCDKVRKKGGHVKHTIMRNDFWLYSDCPNTWKNEIKVSDGSETVIVDAIYKDDWDRRHFIEIDNLQQMKENRNKIKRYKQLLENGHIEEKLGHFPTIIWVTTTEHRREQLKKESDGLPMVMVFTTNDIK